MFESVNDAPLALHLVARLQLHVRDGGTYEHVFRRLLRHDAVVADDAGGDAYVLVGLVGIEIGVAVSCHVAHLG